VRLSDRSLEMGQRLEAQVVAPPSAAGSSAALLLRSPGRAAVVLDRRPVGPDGRALLRARPAASGAVSVALAAATSGEQAITVAAGLAVSTRDFDVLAGRTSVLRGRVTLPRAGRRVTLVTHRGGRWRPLAQARTDAAGRFAIRARTARPGSSAARVVVDGDELNARARRGLDRLDVFRWAHASWYGPGFYGRRTACGRRMSSTLLGVAHKRLRCGTLVTFAHRGRTLRVPVVDRGPYIPGRDFDLTVAAARRLGFGGHGPIRATA
jgi:hypothetical protein